MLLEARKVPEISEYFIASNCLSHTRSMHFEVAKSIYQCRDYFNDQDVTQEVINWGKRVYFFGHKRESTLCCSVLLNFWRSSFSCIYTLRGKNVKAHSTTDNTSICYLQMNSQVASNPLRGEPQVKISRAKLPRSEFLIYERNII